MHILHLTRSIDPLGGCEIYLKNLISTFLSYGHRQSVITAVKPAESIPNDTTVHTINYLANLDYREARLAVNPLAARVDEIKPDLIHIHDLNNPFIIEAARQSKPTIKTTLNADAYCGGIDKYLNRSEKECCFKMGLGCILVAYAEKCMSRHPRRNIEIIKLKKKSLELMNHIAKVIVPSESSKQIMIQNGVKSSQIAAIPLFAGFAHQPILKVKEPSPPEILFLGRLRRYKGVHFLLQATAALKQPYRLIVLGDGEEKSKLMAQAEKLGIRHCCRFLGNLPHDEVLPYLDRCRVVVVPSIYPDSFPTAGLEAMSRKKPVIGFDVGGISGWLKDGLTGYLVPTQNVGILTTNLDYLLANHEQACILGENGYRFFQDHFTAKRHYQTLLALYDDALTNSSKISTGV
ncbi:MAG: hypothetical protein COV74_09210 [Candidatus Omnitrophica bacterium CG11_big_fil_rev_8_21_14_0_20_45_26]|uniref:Glycosyl transferase family 1 n=1 Tax=Candidatus Abzuiibacterium crystallinum TaxID=1974748 RepID=A0A2H0LLW1_9BACT|nr:MAG: hypothetical protein COV74_09210 [Candidatus Omnitrophica bacterium CG11_big_fil_rev_8_21_14_0_20_45_26]PIW63249.1 MAG: hypothetical protein COW12_11185 [Candidatus Omnitrophica bacterium CG12_big_fil_rev_8_21_14_0_65_45_16]